MHCCLALLMVLLPTLGLSGAPLAGTSFPAEALHDPAFPHVTTLVSWQGATVVDPAFAPEPVIGVVLSSDDAADLYLFDPTQHLHMQDGGFVSASGDYHWVGSALGAPELGGEYGSDSNAARLLRRAYAEACTRSGRPVPPLFPTPLWGSDPRAVAWAAGGLIAVFLVSLAVVCIARQRERAREHAKAVERAVARRPWDELHALEALLRERQLYAADLDRELRRVLGEAYVDPATFGAARPR